MAAVHLGELLAPTSPEQHLPVVLLAVHHGLLVLPGHDVLLDVLTVHLRARGIDMPNDQILGTYDIDWQQFALLAVLY